MTPEARIGFIFIFLLIWAVIGVFPWAVAAIQMRGRGALHLLPVVILAAVLAGITVPLAGARDVTGFTISLFTALVGSVIAAAAGAALVPRLLASDDSPRTPRPKRTTPDPHD